MKRLNVGSSNKILAGKLEDLFSGKRTDLKSFLLEVRGVLTDLQTQNEELRRAQIQSEVLKRKYLDLFNLAPVAYFSMDMDFVVKDVNSTAEKLLRRKRNRILHRSFASIVTPLYLNVFSSYKQKIISTRKKQNCELKLKRGDGKEFYSLLESVPVLNENGMIVEIHTTCIDITERRQSELKKQAKLIQTSVENMLDPFMILRAVKNAQGEIANFTFEYINEAGCKSSKRIKEETIGKKILEIFPDFKSNGLFDEFCKVFRTGESSTLKTHYVAPAEKGSGFYGFFDMRINRLNSGVVVTWRNITEKIKAEERISYQSQLLANVSDAVIVTDESLNIVSWNKAAENIFGIKAVEVLGINIFEINYDISNPEKLVEKFKQLKEKGYLSTQEIFYSQDASRKILDSVIIANYDSSGNIKGFIGIIRDITDKVKAEEQVLREKKRLELLTEIAEIFASVTVDIKAVANYTTQKISDSYGDLCIIHLISKDKPEFETLAFHHPDKKAMDFLAKMFSSDPMSIGEGVIGRVIKSEQPVLIPAINSTKDIADIKTGYVKYMDKFGLSAFLGVPIICQNSIIGVLSLFRSRKNESYSIEDQALMQNVANKVSLALSNHRLFIEKLNEIEERKIAQDALASQQQLLQSVLETIPVGVWIIDKDKNKILTNAAARKMWSGLDHSDFNASEEYKSWPAEASGECVELYSWASENALNGEISLNDEILIQCFDGSYKTILNSSVPIIKSNGQIQGAIIVNVDITDRKSYEVKLQQTLIELERSNRELEQFAYIASHDLQEPLRMVSSYTQLLEKQYKDKLDNRAIEYISFAVEGAKRMQSLIIDLLKYARVTTRAQAFETVDCNLVLKEVISDLKMAIDESQADITYDNLPEVNADPTQIRQLLQNLIGNAIKFHSSKKPLIKVSAKFRKNEWIFSVEDNGIGIDQRHYERIFMLFQRLHERDKYTGTGIGLAVCKKIVERHGGRIWPESQLNVGTTMLFSIPA